MKVLVGVDWLTGSFPADSLLAIKNLCFDFGVDLSAESHGFFGYAASLRSESGSFVTWSRGDLGGFARPEACLSLNGTDLACLSAEDVLELFSRLSQLHFDCSRIDLRLDDYDKVIGPEALASVVDRGDFVGLRFLKCLHSSCRGVVGHTVELGRRGSAGCGKMLVCYDKAVESKGVIDAVRWEARFYAERAKIVFGSLVSAAVADFSRLVGGFVLGVVDFRVDAGVDRHTERCVRYSWWQALRDSIGGACSVAQQRVVRGLQEVLDWFKRSVAPSFSLLLEAAERGAFGGGGVAWLVEDLRCEGLSRFDDFHWRLLSGVVRELPF